MKAGRKSPTFDFALGYPFIYAMGEQQMHGNLKINPNTSMQTRHQVFYCRQYSFWRKNRTEQRLSADVGNHSAFITPFMRAECPGNVHM